jgi:hypothetical protein
MNTMANITNNLQEANRHLERQVDYLVMQNRTLQNEMVVLRACPAAAPTAPGAATPATPKEPKMALLPTYQGKANEDTEAWLLQVGLHFVMKTIMFNNEPAKVGFTMSLLTGTTTQWAAPYLDQIATDPIFQLFETFKRNFLSMFGHPNCRKEAECKLNELKQGNGTAREYYANFSHYSMLLGWNNQALISIFRCGLRENVKDELARSDEPPTLSEMALKAILIDNRLAEHARERRSTVQTTAPAYQPFTHTTPATTNPGSTAATTNPAKKDPNAMDVDAAKMSKEQLQKEGHCFRCREKGHLSRDCPKKQIAGSSEANDGANSGSSSNTPGFPQDHEA